MKEYMFKVTYSNFFKVSELPLISFRNCVIRWDAIKFGEGVFLEFNPNLVVFNYVDFDIDIDGLSEILKKFEGVVVPDDVIESYAQKMCPNSLRIFKEWVGDKWILLFEIIGYTLYPKYTFNKAVMLVGEGNNGKSTYIRLIKEILGQENTVSISLQTLCENIFAFSQLYRKLANLFADLPSSPIRYTGIFKLATGEDTITADRKFKDPITFENYAKLIFLQTFCLMLAT
jgi:Predicted ATPase